MSDADSNRRLVLTRTFDASIEKVWQAWTDPKQVAKWWGPKGFTNPVCKVDLSVGGEIYIEMTGPDGTAVPMTGTFQEIDKPHKLSFFSRALEDGKGNADLEVLNIVHFEEKDGKTLLTVEALVQKAVGTGLEAIKGQSQGWSESLDRLQELLMETHS